MNETNGTRECNDINCSDPENRQMCIDICLGVSASECQVDLDDFCVSHTHCLSSLINNYPFTNCREGLDQN